MIVFGEEYIGQIELTKGAYLSVRKKPCVWHRFWMRVLLGWKWRGQRGEQDG